LFGCMIIQLHVKVVARDSFPIHAMVGLLVAVIQHMI